MLKTLKILFQKETDPFYTSLKYMLIYIAAGAFILVILRFLNTFLFENNTLSFVIDLISSAFNLTLAYYCFRMYLKYRKIKKECHETYLKLKRIYGGLKQQGIDDVPEPIDYSLTMKPYIHIAAILVNLVLIPVYFIGGH